MTNTALAASLSILQRMGITNEILQTLLMHIHEGHRSITLRWKWKQICTFDKHVERQIVTSEEEKEYSSTGGYFTQTETTKIKRTAHDFHFDIHANYSLDLVLGTGINTTDSEEEELIIPVQQQTDNHRIDTIIVTGGNSPHNQPRAPVQNETFTEDLDLTWLLQQFDVGGSGGEPHQFSTTFQIDRQAESCRTPRRNADIEKGVKFYVELEEWAFSVRSNLDAMERKIKDPSKDPRLFADAASQPFNPLLPLFEDSSVIGDADLAAFLKRFEDDLESATASIEIATRDVPAQTLISAKEATLGFLTNQLRDVFLNWIDTVQYIEDLLKAQLIQAIGKYVTPQDFDEFIVFHTQQFFGTSYAPDPFSYAVRKDQHYPVGTISIEGGKEPIQTFTRKMTATRQEEEGVVSMYIPVDAATKVEIQGDRYLHGWIQYQWEYPKDANYQIVARANQFSAYIVLMGTMGAGNKFLPKDAIIVQNKGK